MSDEVEGAVEQAGTVTVDIGSWVDKAKKDPAAYIERQVTEVFLTALSMTKPYSHQIFLKGGILMGVVYESPRQTGDIDFTTILNPDAGIADTIGRALAENFPRAAAKLGYPDLMCSVQSANYEPSRDRFPDADGPALKLKVGYARRGSRQQKNFERGRASDVLEVDISFREPVGAFQVVNLGDSGGTIRAYSLIDLISEKIRAFLQQEKRDRYRRQDVYDLDILVGRFSLDDEEKKHLLNLLLEKCRARDLRPDIGSFSDPEAVRRAKATWGTLADEIKGPLPDFDECFARVDEFYRSLPWREAGLA